MSEQTLNVLNRYYDTFDDSFPMAAMSGYEESEVIEIIDKCISEKRMCMIWVTCQRMEHIKKIYLENTVI